jgi:hypothetical protein
MIQILELLEMLESSIETTCLRATLRRSGMRRPYQNVS